MTSQAQKHRSLHLSTDPAIVQLFPIEIPILKYDRATIDELFIHQPLAALAEYVLQSHHLTSSSFPMAFFIFKVSLYVHIRTER